MLSRYGHITLPFGFYKDENRPVLGPSGPLSGGEDLGFWTIIIDIGIGLWKLV